MFGLTGNSLRADPSDVFLDCVHPEDRGRVARVIEKAVEEMSALEIEYRVIRPDGEVRYVHARAKVHSDGSGRAARMVGVSQDVTDRRRSEAALRESEERLRGIFEFSPVGIELFDADGRRVEANQALMKMFGIEDADMIQTFNLLRDRNTTPAMRRDLQKGRVVRQMRWIDFDGMRDNGHFPTTRSGKILLSCTFGPLGAAIPPRGYVSAIEDVTEHWRAEEEIRAFSRRLLSVREEEKMDVSSALHHEVGSMAVGMSARLDDIERRCAECCPPETVDAIRQGKAMLTESIGRLKKLAIEIRPPDLDILGLRAALKELVSQTMQHSLLSVQLTVRGDCRQSGADCATVAFRVVQESLTNAVKHAGAAKAVVEVFCGKRIVRVAVRDDGGGFEPAAVAEAAVASGHLGLRSMRETVESRGGSLEVTSAPGEGTTVLARFPRLGDAWQATGEVRRVTDSG